MHSVKKISDQISSGKCFAFSHKSLILSELNDLSVSTGDGSPNSAFGGGPLSPRHALRELEKAMPKVRINNYISYLL